MNDVNRTIEMEQLKSMMERNVKEDSQ